MGVEVFYNDAVSNETNRGLFCKEHNYSTTDKIRVGLSLNNEFRFGDVTAMVDGGGYMSSILRDIIIIMTIRGSDTIRDCLFSI